MAKPGTLYDWASDANFPAGSDDWSGQPNEIAPSSAKQGTGFIPDTAPAAEEMNALLGNLFEWAAYLNEIVTDEVTRDVYIPISSGKQVGSDTTWAQTGTPPGIRESADNSRRIQFDIEPFVPKGATVDRVAVLVKPGASRLTGNATELEVISQDYNEGSAVAPTTASEGTDEAVSTTSATTLVVGGSGGAALGYTLDHDKSLYLIVTAGNDGGAHNNDELYRVRVTYTVVPVSDS